ncbi:hypothetical protein HY643_01035, partial [Candidatus Woesearchaeota archaeon]|nr:hypothetical protein [Candidatus Woesearchaeota archaeon]
MGDKENPQKPKIILRKADEEETIIKLKKQAIEYEIKLAYQQRELQEKDKKIRELITDIIDAEKEIALIKKATPEIVLETIKQVCKQKPQETNSEQDLPTPAKQQPPKVTPTTQPKNALETYQTELTQIKLNAKNLEERLNAQIIGQEEINKKI